MPFVKLKGAQAPWEPLDAANLRQFLDTVTGKRLLEQMFFLRPRTNSNDITLRAIQSAKKDGYEDLFDQIQNLTDSNRARALPTRATQTEVQLNK